MNILPLVLLLLLVLSALTTQQVERFKNFSIIQKEHRDFLKEAEAEKIQSRQLRLYHKLAKDHSANDYCHTRRINFRAFLDSSQPQISQADREQLKDVTKELMKILYSHTDFYKKIEQTRPQFLDEILDYLVAKSQTQPLLSTKQEIEEIASIAMPDAELQEAFYHMLKGTVDRTDSQALSRYVKISDAHARKSYYSLLKFVRNGSDFNGAAQAAALWIFRCPKETLMAIYGSEDLAQQIIAYRAANRPKSTQGPAEKQKCTQCFLQTYQGKQRSGISDQFLIYEMAKTNPKIYD